MGMFVWINMPPKTCWRCGHAVGQRADGRTAWQSKKCDYENAFDVIDIEPGMNFYDYCRQCEAWNEYDVIAVEEDGINDVVFNEAMSKEKSLEMKGQA